jgi:hypothetical protein
LIYLCTFGLCLIGQVIDYWTLNDQVDECNRKAAAGVQ